MPPATLMDTYRVAYTLSSRMDPYAGSPFYADVVVVEALDPTDAAHQAERWVRSHCRHARVQVEPIVAICRVSLEGTAHA